MALSSPLLDTRTIDEIMGGLMRQAQIDLPNWKQAPDDAGVMLQRIFARLIEIALQRLNQVPQKNLLAFLDAMGVSVRPPSTAKAPLTFSLLPNAPPTFVARGAQVDTEPSAQAPATTFETMRDFTVLPAQVVRAFTMDPVWDRFADRTEAIAGLIETGFTPFVGTERIPHVLLVGDDVFLNCSVPVVATLGIVADGADADFWSALIYQYVSGGTLITADATTDPISSGSASMQTAVALKLDETVDETTLAGVGLQASVLSRWLQVNLPAPITDFVAAAGVTTSAITLAVRNQHPFAPDAAFNDQTPLELTQNFLPFGPVPGVGSCLYLASAEAFAKPNSAVTLNVGVAATDQLVLVWEHYDGAAWSQLPAANIQDGTKGFAKNGTVSVALPAGNATVRRTTVAVRARLISGTYRGFPSFIEFDIRDKAKLAEAVQGQVPTGSPKTATIKVDTSAIAETGDPAPGFAAIGQILDVDGELAVVLNNVGDGKRLIIMPAPSRNHPASSPVQLEYASEVGTLTAAVAGGGQSLTLSAAAGSIGQSSTLLIDDMAAVEFVTVQSVDGTVVRLSAPLQFAHAVGTSVALMTQGLHLYGMANDRWVDTTAISDADPFVPFGTRPGPGNLFMLYAEFMGFESLAGGVRLGGATALGGTTAVASGITIGPVGMSPQVQINFHVKIDKNLPKVDITWEYLGASGWTTIESVVDATNSFQLDGPGTVSLGLGTLVPGQVNSQQGYWIRARITDGNYGVPLMYMPVDPTQPALGYAVLPGSGNLHPPILSSLTLAYVTERKSPQRLIAQNGFFYNDRSGTSNPFAPFVPVADLVPFEQADPEPAFYLGFDAAFPQQPVTLYFDATARMFSTGIVREVSVAPSLIDQALRWEYFNGAVWSPLAVVDWTDNLTESGELEFLTPLDIQPLARFDTVARYWIRARSAGNDPLTTQELVGVFANTTTVVHGVSVAGEVLGSSDGTPNQSFRIARTPVLSGQQVTVREPEPPSGKELAKLSEEEGDDAVQRIVNPVSSEVETWVRWHEVSNFLASAPYSRHYVLDHRSGTLTFGAMIPPAGAQNITVSYRSGGGSVGNVPDGAIGQIKSTLPGVASVANPSASDGGADAETMTMVSDRGLQAMKHRGRALAAADFEWLAHEAGGSRVARAKCISNVNRELAFEPGWTTLLVVPNGGGAKPMPNSELIADIESYLADRAFVGLAKQTPVRINVIGPGYIRVAVSANIVPVDLVDAIVVQQQVLTALAAYFHPITGGASGEGWGFGQPVHESKVSALIENVPGVDHVAALQLIPDLAQHYLILDGGSVAAAHVQQAAQALTVDRSKAARLPAADVGTGGLLINGFKEGDRLAKVTDVVVQSAQAGDTSIGVSFTADSTGIPRGSVIMTFDGQQRARLAAGILPHQAVTSLPFEGPLTVQPGDVVTLVYPFPLTVRAVTPEAIELTVREVQDTAITVAPFSTDIALPQGTVVCSVDGNAMSHLVDGIGAGQAGVTGIAVADIGFVRSLTPGNTILLLTPSVRLNIESYEAVLPFASGSIMATLDNAVRLPLLEGVAAGQRVNKIRLGDFAPGDSLAPIDSSSTAINIRTVEPVYDQVVIDDNFLAYSGPHRIAMVEE
jgi:hypothetical protein